MSSCLYKICVQLFNHIFLFFHTSVELQRTRCKSRTLRCSSKFGTRKRTVSWDFLYREYRRPAGEAAAWLAALWLQLPEPACTQWVRGSHAHLWGHASANHRCGEYHIYRSKEKISGDYYISFSSGILPANNKKIEGEHTFLLSQDLQHPLPPTNGYTQADFNLYTARRKTKIERGAVLLTIAKKCRSLLI